MLRCRRRRVPLNLQPDLGRVKHSDPKVFKIIGRGKGKGHVDTPKIAKGEPIFSIDTDVPGMVSSRRSRDLPGLRRYAGDASMPTR